MKFQSLKYLLPIAAIFLLFSCNEGTTAKKQVSADCEEVNLEKSSTNPEIMSLQKAMVAFRKSLSADLLSQGSACLNSERFYLWHNTPANKRGKRDGITYGDLNEEQLKMFKSIMQLFLSSDGYQKVREITELSEGWLNEIKSDIWNPSFYSIDMFGDPEKSGSWGFQLDGHHCVVNFLVHGDKVSIVPAFLGGEPAKETYKGQAFDIFKDERDLALSLYGGMSDADKKMAITKSSTRALEVGAAERPGKPDPYIGDYDYSGFKKGLKFSEMSGPTQENLIILMKEYTYNLNDKFADKWWADINTNIDDTYFTWIDDVDTPSMTSQFYYRIYNPYLWVEFNTENVTGANANNMEPWNHIHTITRIPNNPATNNGGDYGIFASTINQNGPGTLYEHYALADHHKRSNIDFDYEVSSKILHTGNHAHTH